MDTVKKRKKIFTYFIGIDVSKNELDYAVMRGNKLLFHEEGRNEPDNIIAFQAKLKTLPGFTMAKSVFCMEHTGFYVNHLVYSLKKLKANIVVEHPLTMKNSMGIVRGKDDKSDAIRIAAYAQKNREELKLWEVRRPVVVALSNLFSLRNRLLAISLRLQVPLSEQGNFINKGLHKQNVKSCKRSIDAVKADLIDIEQAISKLICTDEQLKRTEHLVTSVPNIGRITAIQMIICTNEFRDIRDPRKFACYAGVAPFKSDSGVKYRKGRVSQQANKKMKSLLHICALSAINRNEELKKYFIRKTQIDGKPKMAVINAIRSKLILRVFACVNQNRPYIKNYVRAEDITASGLTKTQV